MRQWFSVPRKDRIELLKGYKRNGFSYNEAINDFEDSFKKFDEGRFVSESTSVNKKNPLLEKQLIDDLAYKTGLVEEFDKGNVSIDLDFRDKFGKSIHQYKYETNKAYKDKFDENIKNSTNGSIQYPINDARRAGSINPNTAWMYPQIKDPKLRKGMESFSNEVIGTVTPIPGLQAVGKLPSILGEWEKAIKIGRSLIKPVGKAVSKADDVAKNLKFADFNNEDEYFRIVVGDEAFEDIVKSNKVRTNYGRKPKSETGIDLSNRGTLYPSFAKGQPSLEYAKSNPNHYIIRTSDSSIKPSTVGRHGKGSTMFPTDEFGKHLPELDASKVMVYKHVGGGKYELVFQPQPVNPK